MKNKFTGILLLTTLLAVSCNSQSKVPTIDLGLDHGSIANFTNYRSLGMASAASAQAKKQRIKYASDADSTASESTATQEAVGEKEDGTIEPLSFLDEKGNVVSVEGYNVTLQYKNELCSILTISNTAASYHGMDAYIINNQTGKLFSAKFGFIPSDTFFYFTNNYDSSVGINNSFIGESQDEKTYSRGELSFLNTDTNGKVIIGSRSFRAEDKTDGNEVANSTTNNSTETYISRFYFDNDKMILEDIGTSKVEQYFYRKQIDKYGNLISESSDGAKIIYVLDSAKEFYQYSYKSYAFLGYNGIYYIDGKILGEDGKLQDIDYEPSMIPEDDHSISYPSFFDYREGLPFKEYPTDEKMYMAYDRFFNKLLLKDGKDAYYFPNKESQIDHLWKFTFTDEDKCAFEYQSIPLDEPIDTEKRVYLNGRFYLVTSDGSNLTLDYIDVKTGKKIVKATTDFPYYIQTWELDGRGGISFTALDHQQNLIYGTMDGEGNVTNTSTEKPKFSTYTLFSVN